jgi:hypothetical protein
MHATCDTTDFINLKRVGGRVMRGVRRLVLKKNRLIGGISQ